MIESEGFYLTLRGGLVMRGVILALRTGSPTAKFFAGVTLLGLHNLSKDRRLDFPLARRAGRGGCC